MKSYADEEVLAESAQPFLLSDEWHRRKPRLGRICFWENWNFERNVVQNPSKTLEMHNTSRQLHKRRESVNKKRRFRRTSLYTLFLCQPDGGFHRFVPTFQERCPLRLVHLRAEYAVHFLILDDVIGGIVVTHRQAR